MKRHLRTIRGPQGLKGEKGLSAYGVWLKAGHTGTKDRFFFVPTAKALRIHSQNGTDRACWQGNRAGMLDIAVDQGTVFGTNFRRAGRCCFGPLLWQSAGRRRDLRDPSWAWAGRMPMALHQPPHPSAELFGGTIVFFQKKPNFFAGIHCH